MEIIPRLIRDYNLVLYAVCFIAFAYFVFTGVSAMRQLRRATFRLERQTETNRIIGAWFRAGVCILVALAVNVISGLAPAPTAAAGGPGVAATRPPSAVLQATSVPTAQTRPLTGTSSLSGTPAAGTPLPGTPRPAATQTGPAPTPTRAQQTASQTTASQTTAEPTAPTPTAPQPTPSQTTPSQTTATPPPTAAPVASTIATNCGSPDAQITSPAAGERVGGPAPIRGTAVVDAGGYYKLEVLVPGAAQWSFINRGDQSVRNGVLVQGFNFSNLAPGSYPLRLVIVRPEGNLGAVCQIPITVG